MVQKQTSIPWDDLRIALALAEAGSVRSASRALGVSHSTVLRRLAALESSVGVRLFERKVEGYEVTPAGQDVFDTASELHEVVTALERRVAGRDQRLSGAVRVTLPDPLLSFFLPVLRDFNREYPDIEVTLAVGVSYLDLAHREADIAIRLAAEPPPDLVGRRVATVATGIYGTDKYLAGRSTRDLASLDWVTWAEDSQMAFAQWVKKNVPKAHIALRATAPWALRDAVNADLGVTVLPCATGDREPTWRRVRLVREITAPIWVLTHRDLRATPRVRALRDFLVAGIESQRALLEGRSPRAG